MNSTDKNKDRQVNYMIRNSKKKIAENEGDLILQFIINCAWYFQETSVYFTNVIKLESAQMNYEDQLKKLQNKSFLMLLESSESQKIFFQCCGQVSLIKASHFFSEISMRIKFLIIHQLLKYDKKLANDIIYYACQYSKKPILQCLQFIESFCEKFNNQELTVYCFILVSEFYNLCEQNLTNLIQLFRIDQTIEKFDQICNLSQITNNQFQIQSDNLNKMLGQFSEFTLKDWFTVKYTLGYKAVEFFYYYLAKDYFKVQKKANFGNLLHKILLKLGVIIQKSSGPYIWSSKQLFILLSQKTLNYFIINIQESRMSSEKVFKSLLYILFQLLQKLGFQQKLLMLDFLHQTFDTSTIRFLILKDYIKKNIQHEYCYKYFVLNYYHQIQAKELLLKEAQSLFCSNQEIYIELLQNSNYFNNFQLNSQYLTISMIQRQFPFAIEIALEDFNISLQEMTQKELEQILKEWLECTNNSMKFKQLIPIYFNLIKRKDSSKKLLSIINRLKGTNIQGINMKTLFQILYNNSNNELKSMLLKFWSTTNPVPMIYQNPNIQSEKINITVEEDLYCLNKKLNFIFPDCLPIISFSLSRKQNSYGKTQLINQIFYQAEVFDVSDHYTMNANTIDIMFDFCFSGSRQFAVADVHGIIPLNILLKILPLFQVWIIQMDSEIEFQENLQQLLEIQKRIKISECCLIIRNSTLKLEQILQEVTISNVSIHKVIDLTQKGLDKQTINSAIEEVQKFIFEKIEKQKQFSTHLDFQRILQAYYGKNHDEINDINERQQILMDLNEELERLVEQPDGFFSQNAFPIRSLMLKIRQLKFEQYQLDGLSKVEKEDKIQKKQNEIEKLEKQIPQQQSTLLLDLFQKIFLLPDYYLIYLQFTDQIRKFNDQHTQKLQDTIQKTNEEIQEKKKKKKQMRAQDDLKENQQVHDPDNLKNLKLKLKQQQIQLEQINISIELFWRELTQLKQKVSRHQLVINPIEVVARMIRKGENFELLDGDSLQVDQQFLKDIVNEVTGSDNQNVLVISIIGPQSSGKSTILNKIFGCHFWTSVGRCTKGIYLQLLKIKKQQYFNNQFDYILILDTEGLQNPNQKDHEFDKKITLFIISISDIILLNVKGDIHSQFKNLVEMCIYTLSSMKNVISSSKQLSWCFNQNNDCKNLAPFLQQIQSIATNLNQGVYIAQDNQEFDYFELLNINKDSIKILGFAQTEQIWRVNAKWRQQIVNETFAEEAYIFGIQMIKQFVQSLQSQSISQSHTLSKFIQNIECNWQMINKFPDLLEFTELQQQKQDQSMKAIFDSSYSDQFNDYKMEILNKIQLYIKDKKYQNIELLKQLEIELKQFVQQENRNIQQAVQQKLLAFKQENQIQYKIYKKYQKLLDDTLNQNECYYFITIFTEINKYKQECLQKTGFAQLDEFVIRTRSDAKQLEKLQGNPKCIEDEFLKIWNNIIQNSKDQQEKVFSKFSQTHYQTISSSFKQSIWKSNNFESYLHNFEELSKQSPFKKVKQLEKEEIFHLYQNENQKSLQFVLIPNNQENMNYTHIYTQPIAERLKKSNDTFLINLNDYYDHQVTLFQIGVSDFKKYILGQFYQDFLQHLMVLWQYETKNYQNKLFVQFFSILQICNIVYDEVIYQQLKTYVLLFCNKNSNLNETPGFIFSAFLAKLEFPQGNNFIENEEFSKNLKNQYPNLKVYEQRQQIKSLDDCRICCQSQKQKIFFLLKQDYQPKNNILSCIKNSNSQDDIQQWIQQLMISSKGWEKVYFQIYDIVRQKMTKNLIKQHPNCVDDEEILASDKYLNQQIISSIEQQILDYNQQFANFGVIFSELSVRSIYYYSTFLILRFSCYHQWKQQEENHQKLVDMKKEQYDKFFADILQYKTDQSLQNAQLWAQYIKQSFLEKFYKDQQQTVNKFINYDNISCSKLISDLDSRLLQNYQIAKGKNISDTEIFEYVMDQKSYIEKYSQNYILQQDLKIKNYLNIILRQELQTFVQSVMHNISQIQNITKKHNGQLKSEDFFSTNKFQNFKNDSDGQLFFMISRSIQGEIISKQNLSVVNIDLREIFEQNFKTIKIPIFTKFKNESDLKIPQLKPFIDQLYHLLSKPQYYAKEPLIWENFNTQEGLNQLKLIMIGCQFSCPMCRRKCDQPDDNNHKHSCQNGHLYRGMNGVLINNMPSLLTCEEINDNALVTTLETSVQRTWSSIKNAYHEWNFNILNDEKLILQSEKMKKIWNTGTGELICKELSKKFKKEIKFQKNEGFGSQLLYEMIHYIIMLDDSGSMQGKKWELARKGAIQCMKDISKNGDAKVSVIIFNSVARVVIDCQKVEIDKQKNLIEFKSGETDFNSAFFAAFAQITKYSHKQFEKNIILFYTDGDDKYPKEAVDKFKTLPQNLRSTIKLFSCADGKKNITLNEITQQLKKSNIEAELRQNITAEVLGQVWTEVVSENYHNLKG